MHALLARPLVDPEEKQSLQSRAYWPAIGRAPWPTKQLHVLAFMRADPSNAYAPVLVVSAQHKHEVSPKQTSIANQHELQREEVNGAKVRTK